MIIRDTEGRPLVKTDHKTIRQTLEWCVAEGVYLPGADLRKAKLSQACLDGLQARGCSLWGADLSGADIGYSDLRHADLRCAMFKDTCLVQSDLSAADLRGAYFSCTLLDEARLDGATVSCPSFWDCDLQNLRSMMGLVYSHLGEDSVTLSTFPVVIKGFSKRLVMFETHGLWGNDLCAAGEWPQEAERALFSAKTIAERVMRRNILHAANKPILKIPPRTAPF